MRYLAAVAAAASFVALACSGGPTETAASCAPFVTRAQGAVFVGGGQASAAEAGPVFSVVQRQRKCEDVFVIVTDSAAPAPKRDPWADGDSFLPAGTKLYQRAGSEPGQELVVEYAPGEWVRLVKQRGS